MTAAAVWREEQKKTIDCSFHPRCCVGRLSSRKTNMARRKKNLSNGDAKTKPSNDTIWVVLVFVAVFLTLATMALVLASLWGLGKYCVPPPSLFSVSQTTNRNHRFWQKKELVPAPETPSPSQFCQTAWALVARVPFLTWKVKPKEEPQECREERKRNLLQKLQSLIFKKRKPSSPATELASAFTKEITLSKSQGRIMKKLFTRFRDHTPHFQERAAAVAWGGPGGSHWYTPNLLAANLRIMRWPEDLQTHFPFKLCPKGCSSEVALSHTLEWREKYKPWLMSPCSISENQDGFVYVHGHGRSLSRDVHSGHAMVWVRAGLKTNGVTDPECYFRAILNSLDQAVHVTLHRSHNQVGKFNVVIDAAHVSFHILPNLGDTKKAIVMLQDHFPDRLGMVILANLGKGPEFLLNMIKPLITKEVRDKIQVLPHDATKRHKVLEAIVEHEFIPDYLGGTDTFQFNAKEYYSHKRLQWTDAEAKQYLQTMPYHA